MRFLKKLILWLIILIIILLGALFLTLKFIVTPDRFKPVISSQIEKLTGYHVEFKGPLGWDYLPQLSVNANNVVLTSSNKDQVSVEHLTFGVKLLPLLHKQLELTHINIDDINYQNSNGDKTQLHNLSISAKPFVLDKIFRLRVSGEIVPGDNSKKVSTINISAATLISQKTNSIDLDPMTIVFNNNTAKGDFHFNHDESLKPNPDATMPNSINFNGNFKSDKWQIDNMVLNNLRVKFDAKDSVIDINPFLTDFYQGKAQGQASINLQSKTPRFSLSTNLVGAQVGGFLKDIVGQEYATGTLMADLNIEGQGVDTDEILKSLNGSINSTMTDGELRFADLNHTISSALLVIGQTKVDKKTLSLFDSLKMQAQLNSTGIANLDLNLLSDAFKATANGEVDLLKQTIDLMIKAYYTRSKNTADIAIPINISGPIISPNVSVNASSTLLNTVVNKGSKDLKNLGDSLKKLFG